MTTRPQRYQSYMLRIWQVADGDRLVWRASLETPLTGERRGFGRLRELACWLEGQADVDTRRLEQDERGADASAPRRDV